MKSPAEKYAAKRRALAAELLALAAGHSLSEALLLAYVRGRADELIESTLRRP